MDDERVRQLSDLPDELIAACYLTLADDDFQVLTMPLVSVAFRRAARQPAVAAVRLASRLRQVVAGACISPDRVYAEQPRGGAPMGWRFGHAWAALDAARAFLVQEGESSSHRWSVLDAAGGLGSLTSLLDWCEAVGLPPPAPPAPKAEELFLQTERARQKLESERRLPSRELELKRAEGVGDRQARDAAAALNLQSEGEGGRSAVRQEVERQARRQLEASCRREWKQMPASKRREWAQYAHQCERQREADRSAAAEVVELAAELARCARAEGYAAPVPPSDEVGGRAGGGAA